MRSTLGEPRLDLRSTLGEPRLDLRSNLTKLFVAQYVIRHSDSNREIGQIYEWIISQTRSCFARGQTVDLEFINNAVDILLQSNHTRYKTIADTFVEHLRKSDDNKVTRNLFGDKGETQQVGEILAQHAATLRNPLDLSEEEVAVQHALLEQLKSIHRSKTALLVAETPRTIYQDKQNTHDHKINETVKRVAKKLCASQVPNAFIGISNSWIRSQTLDSLNLSGEAKSKISKSLERITTDATVIDQTITLGGTFRGLVKLISEEPDPITKKELGKTLISALQDMSGMCFTGHLSGLASVPQGIKLESIPKIEIDISDEVYATLSHQLNRHLQLPENDPVMNELTDGNLLPYYQVIKTYANGMLPGVYKEYQDTHSEANVNLAMVKAVNKYAKGIDVKNITEL